MDLIIGAPVYERAWIIDQWFGRLSDLRLPDGMDFSDVTILLNDGGSRDGTLDIVRAYDENMPWNVEVIDSDLPSQSDRKWSFERYKVMAELRNQLLDVVRKASPAYYWSHDTDILAPEMALLGLLEGQERFNGVAPTVYMTKHSTVYPNAMRLLGNNRGKRAIPQGEGVVRVDVVFASVLMDPELYAIDYVAHEQGEDIGWGFEAKAAGLTMGLDLACKCKHVMTKEQAHAVDLRVGF